MTLPNAHGGVQKIFIAEILSLIGTLLVLVGITFYGAILGIYSSVGHETPGMSGLAIGGTLSLVGGAFLPILALILNLVGLRQASKDEPDYMNKAFWCAIWALILGVVSSVFQSLGWGGAVFFDVVGSILEICMMVFSIMGVSEVTQNISRQDVADMGPKIITISVIAMVVAIIAVIVGNFIGGVAALISVICTLVAYFVYIVFLARATSALAKG